MPHSTVTLTVTLRGIDGQPAQNEPVTVLTTVADAIAEAVVVRDRIVRHTNTVGVVRFQLIASDDLSDGSQYWIEYAGQQRTAFHIAADAEWHDLRDTPTPVTVPTDDRPRLLPDPSSETDGRIVVVSGGAWVIGDAATGGGTAVWHVGTTAPASPVVGQGWLDTSATEARGRIWDGSQWDPTFTIGPNSITAAQMGVNSVGLSEIVASVQARLLPDSPADDQVAQWDASAGEWVAADLPATSTGGASTLAALTDVSDAGATTGEVLTRRSDGSYDFQQASVPAATTTARGSVEIATNAETRTGTDSGRAVTPQSLRDTINSRVATEANQGTTRTATDAEVAAGTADNRQVTPAKLRTELRATPLTRLNDTPSTYGQAGERLAVNAARDGYEHVAAPEAATRGAERIGPPLALAAVANINAPAHRYTFTVDPNGYDEIFFRLVAGEVNVGGETDTSRIGSETFAGAQPNAAITAGAEIAVPEVVTASYPRAERTGSLNWKMVATGDPLVWWVGTPGCNVGRGLYDVEGAYGVSYRSGSGGGLGPQGPQGTPGADGAPGATSWTALTETPAAIVADAPVVGNAAGDALVFGMQSAAASQVITPTNYVSATATQVQQLFSGLRFESVSNGAPTNALNTPTELTFATPLSTTTAGSYLTLEIVFEGNGTDRANALYVGRQDGANTYRELDAQTTTGSFRSFNPAERSVFTARLHTDEAEFASASGTYTWRIFVGSTTPATVETGTFLVAGTITPPPTQTLLPNSWLLAANLGAGYTYPYRTDGFFTDRSVVPFDRPLNLRQVSEVWVDCDIAARTSYGATAGRPVVLLPMPQVYENRVGLDSSGLAQYDASKVLLVGNSHYQWGGGQADGSGLGGGIGLHFVAGNSLVPQEITHFSVVISNSTPPWSRGHINGIYAR